jgi:hypothetical protein
MIAAGLVASAPVAGADLQRTNASVSGIDAIIARLDNEVSIGIDAVLQRLEVKTRSDVDAVVQQLGVWRRADMDAAIQRKGNEALSVVDAVVQRAGAEISSGLDARLVHERAVGSEMDVQVQGFYRASVGMDVIVLPDVSHRPAYARVVHSGGGGY